MSGKHPIRLSFTICTQQLAELGFDEVEVVRTATENVTFARSGASREGGFDRPASR